MNEKHYEVKNTLLLGILLILLQPIIYYIVSFLNNIIGTVWQSFNDMQFEFASSGGLQGIMKTTFLMMGSLWLVLVWVIFIMSKLFIVNIDSLDNKYLDLIKSINDKEFNEGLTTRTKSRLDGRPNINWKSTISLILISNFLYIFILVAGIKVQNLNNVFNKKLNIIAPYTDNQNIKVFRSHWAQMKTETDFNKINSSLDNLFTKNGLKVPEK